MSNQNTQTKQAKRIRLLLQMDQYHVYNMLEPYNFYPVSLPCSPKYTNKPQTKMHSIHDEWRVKGLLFLFANETNIIM